MNSVGVSSLHQLQTFIHLSYLKVIMPFQSHLLTLMQIINVFYRLEQLILSLKMQKPDFAEKYIPVINISMIDVLQHMLVYNIHLSFKAYQCSNVNIYQ